VSDVLLSGRFTKATRTYSFATTFSATGVQICDGETTHVTDYHLGGDVDGS
jgi:hypothetical protein